MLTDYIDPEERSVACPNQDVVYGGASRFAISPVVIQVPDFGDRFWVYQVVDPAPTASSSSARCTAPPRASTCWSGQTGTVKFRKASQVFRSSTNTGLVALASRRTTRRKTSGRPIGLARINVSGGGIRRADEDEGLGEPAEEGCAQAAQRRRNGCSGQFVDGLPPCSPRGRRSPGEEARYAQVLAVVTAARDNPAKQAMTEGAKEADENW